MLSKNSMIYSSAPLFYVKTPFKKGKLEAMDFGFDECDARHWVPKFSTNSSLLIPHRNILFSRLVASRNLPFGVAN
ncbi:hypothetical protein A2415_03175 [candidate division WWE3 bacterium RIFOXYC1_FULL_39_7]|uniref:Uncharacterized protein n=1 Tax=candidate division WWE3 bacterium RIFOXYC1_FULL_39_7 TaxID=1802643 RepID=A0A1F4WKX4_UNCKA|nr:MAG: hypothetical protein A2415_03175 [candidate division WWE3 bacterium RIFOXYC1_FULL_39_7]